MGEAIPMQKASMTKLILSEIRALALGEQCLRSVDPGIVAEVDDAARTEWLPSTHALALYTCVREFSGDAAVFRVGRTVTRISATLPLFTPVVQTVLNVFGATAGHVVAALPRAFGFSTRDTARCRVDEHEGGFGSSIVIEGVPVVLREHVYGVSWAGSIRGLLDVAKIPGRVSGYGHSLGGGRLEYEVRWQADEAQKPCTFEEASERRSIPPRGMNGP